MKQYYVYLMSNPSRTLYAGVTGNLRRRVQEHKQGSHRGFTRHYRATRLVYFETFGDARAAIAREKQVKGWVRSRKVALVASTNPLWQDLSPKLW